MQVSAYTPSSPIAAPATTSASLPTGRSDAQTLPTSATPAAVAPTRALLANTTLTALLQSNAAGSRNDAQQSDSNSNAETNANSPDSTLSVSGLPVSWVAKAAEDLKEFKEGLLRPDSNATALPGVGFVPTKGRLTAMISDLTRQISSMSASISATADPALASAMGRDYDIAKGQLAAYQQALPNAPDAPSDYVFTGEVGDWSNLDPNTTTSAQLENQTTVETIQRQLQEVQRLAQAAQNLESSTGGSISGWSNEYKKLNGWVTKYQQLLAGQVAKTS